MGQFQNAPGPSNEEFNNVVDQISTMETDTSVTGVVIFRVGNCVCVKIAQSTTASQSGNVTIATIPSNYRPYTTITAREALHNNVVQLSSNGNVIIYGATASTGYEVAFTYPITI